MISAMIFAAGFGTRLKPWTDEHPKALVEMSGIPMLGRVIEKMKMAGAERIIVNTHHFAEQIHEYLRPNDNFGVEMLVSHEPELLDTGGGVSNALIRYGVDGPLILHNADILTDFPMAMMLKTYEESGCRTQLLVSGRTTSRYLLFNESGVMRGWYNPSTGEVRGPAKEMAERSGLCTLAFGGVHLLNEDTQRHIVEYGRERKAFSIIDFYIDECDAEPLQAFIPDAPYLWHDVGTSDKLAAARQAWQNKYGDRNV